MSRFNSHLIDAAASVARRAQQRGYAIARKSRTAMVAGLALVSSMSFAAAPSFSGITDAVDWSTVGVGILAVAALKAVPLVVSVGSKMVLRAIGR